jgi:type IV pilus assembly protein PilC
VVPQFQTLFQGFGADLPAFTMFVVNLSEFLQKWWWAVFGGIGLIAFAYVQTFKRSEKFRRGVDVFTLKIPVVGELVRKSAIARFSRTLATMFSAGVPLVEAMESVAGATGNAVYSEAVLKMRDDAATGTQLQQSMRTTNVFPNMVIQMVAIGEESGSLDSMLTKVADFFEQEVDNLVDGLSSLLEPLIMAVLGVLVGGLVVAMYLPIFKMGAVVG